MKKSLKIVLSLVLFFSFFIALPSVKVNAESGKTLTINILGADGESTSAYFESGGQTYVYEPTVDQKYWFLYSSGDNGNYAMFQLGTVTPSSGSGTEENKFVKLCYNPGSTFTIEAVGGTLDSSGYIFKSESMVVNIYVKDSTLIPAVAPTYKTPGCEEYYMNSATNKFYDEYGELIPDLDDWKAEGGYGYIPKLVDSNAPTNLSYDISQLTAHTVTIDFYGEDDSNFTFYVFLNGEQKGILDAYDNTESISCGSLLSKQEYEIKFYAKDELGNQSDTIIATFTTLGDTELVKVSGLEATDTEAGYLECYMCESCKYYYEDSEGKKFIGGETEYNTWKLENGAGYIGPRHGIDDNHDHICDYCDRKVSEHELTKVNEVSPYKKKAGTKAYYKCESCGLYFEDEAATVLIGDETQLNVWKANEGLIAAKSSNVALIVILSIFGLLIVAFIVLYILWRELDFNVPFLSKFLKPAFRAINNLLFKTKLNKVELKKENNN